MSYSLSTLGPSTPNVNAMAQAAMRARNSSIMLFATDFSASGGG